jgi:hypothetical protein
VERQVLLSKSLGLSAGPAPPLLLDFWEDWLKNGCGWFTERHYSFQQVRNIVFKAAPRQLITGAGALPVALSL